MSFFHIVFVLFV